MEVDEDDSCRRGTEYRKGQFDDDDDYEEGGGGGGSSSRSGSRSN